MQYLQYPSQQLASTQDCVGAMDFFAIINAVGLLRLSNCNQNAKINHNYELYNYLLSMPTSLSQHDCDWITCTLLCGIGDKCIMHSARLTVCLLVVTWSLQFTWCYLDQSTTVVPHKQPKRTEFKQLGWKTQATLRATNSVIHRHLHMNLSGFTTSEIFNYMMNFNFNFNDLRFTCAQKLTYS